jgi:GMP synthase (glutamine-hydrolysing)
MHWHGDTFDLPPGAALLWTGRRYRHQAFRVGATAYGLQFHLELTSGLVTALISSAGNQLARHGVDAAAILRETPAACARLAPMATQVFMRWLDL